ncbi:hypothetical protein MUK42_37444 [Musa troglodytarum]|uniref:Uncharacterized protein n=1 Tax=Musa troglodytarum TaxID=320322 RepID=A0A9E7EBE1_9LILI|nr:hypothetical protein MUK42_37444 [Musa troglodytarum]
MAGLKQPKRVSWAKDLHQIVDVRGIYVCVGSDYVRILDVEPEVRSINDRRLRMSGIEPRRAGCTKDIGVAEVNHRLGNGSQERMVCRRIGRSVDQ